MKFIKMEKRLENKLGDILEITKINKGFSNEEKYILKTKSNTFLLRISSAKFHCQKKQEFEIMKRLFRKGVSCNKPIGIFKEKDDGEIFSLFSYLPGYDAEEGIDRLAESVQFQIGFKAGQDLKKINSIKRNTTTWKERKIKKHENYLSKYSKQEYRFDNDRKVIKFIEMNCDSIASGPDRFQHDDFHLGNIVINNEQYAGILDFNRYDWGDPLHEFVKLEWFTWPVSREFARGQVQGYFGEKISREECLRISLYIAMSIFSTIVWTMKFHPHTMPFIENRIHSILESYEYFDRIRPEWL